MCFWACFALAAQVVGAASASWLASADGGLERTEPMPAARSFLQRSATINQYFAIVSQDASVSPTPKGVSPLDLWAIHDLLLVGHRAPLLQEPGARPADGTATVQAAASSLAGMLHEIHPIPACRKAVGDAESLIDKAEATWTCLGLSAKNFSGAATSESSQPEPDNTEPNFHEMLGACAGSKWPRGCSYWASMHAMGVRADMGQRSADFLNAMLRIISGGALYCFGCTSHFILLNKYLLPPELRNVDKFRQY